MDNAPENLATCVGSHSTFLRSYPDPTPALPQGGGKPYAAGGSEIFTEGRSSIF